MVRERAAEWKRRNRNATVRAKLYGEYDIMGSGDIRNDIWDGNKIYVTEKSEGEISEIEISGRENITTNPWYTFKYHGFVEEREDRGRIWRNGRRG